MQHTCTYSPEDNKLRLSPAYRLPPDEYERVKAAGFSWAPKQENFIAPAWTPGREDLALELCGEIGDEDTSLMDRAEDRAERFEEYSEKRADDADRAQQAVSAIADNIPLGQPILVGHHSERRARKDAERIEKGMRKAVNLWKTSQYWAGRAKAAVRHAKYKERPDVRHRRIKTLAADKRKQERNKAEAENIMHLWAQAFEAPEKFKKKDGSTPNIEELAYHITNYYDHTSHCFTVAEYPRPEGVSTYEGSQSLWSALKDKIITPAQARAISDPYQQRLIAHANRWIEHLDNRIAYEKAMLDDQGGTVAGKFDIKVGGEVLLDHEWVRVLRVNKNKGGEVVSLTTSSRYVSVRGIEEVKDYRPPAEGDAEKVKAATKLAPLVNYPGEGFLHLTKEEWKRKPTDYKGTRHIPANEQHGAHRQRYCMAARYQTPAVYITDEKRKDPPPAPAPEPEPEPTAPEPGPDFFAPKPDLPAIQAQNKAQQQEQRPPTEAALRETMEQMQAVLTGGLPAVQVVHTPDFFPTPPELATQVVEMANVEDGHRVLEPSAGSGNLIVAVADLAGPIVAVETNPTLAEQLRRRWNDGSVTVHCADFLTCNGDLGKFDRIIMNPPFTNAADIRHIQHARTFLKPGGRLVAICANGPRQRAAFEKEAEEFIDLPADSFKASGTSVNTAIVVFTAPMAAEPNPDAGDLTALLK